MNLAVKPKGKKSKGPENPGEAGSVQVQINWRLVLFVLIK